LNYLLVGRQSNEINQSTQHRLLSDCEKGINSFEIFFFHCHVHLYHCASIMAAFLNTERLKYNISYLPLVSSAKRNFKSNRPSAEAASASQDISIDKPLKLSMATQQLPTMTDATAPSAAAPAAAADGARRHSCGRCRASGRHHLASFTWTCCEGCQGLQGSGHGRGRRQGSGIQQGTTSVFMLDLVYHATATNAPL
jgi:hypothetical protein